MDSVLTPAIRVTVRNQTTGQVAATGSWSVTLELLNPNGAILSGPVTVATAAGEATFAGLKVSRSGNYTLRASASGANAPASAASQPVAVLAPPVVVDQAKLKLTTDSSQVASGTLTFQVTGTAPKIEAGSVLVGPEYGGYLRKVRTVQQSGSTVTVQTDPAALTDAVREGSVKVSEQMSLAPGIQPSAPGSPIRWGPAAVIALTPGVTITNGRINLQDVVLWGEGNSGLVVKNGSITFTPQLNLDLAISNWAIQSLEATVSGSLTFETNLWFGVSGATSKSLPIIPIATVNKPFVAVVGGWPVYGRYVLTWNLVPEIGASAEASVQSGIKATGGLTVGARYLNGSWQNLTAPTGAFEVKPLTITAKGNAYARVGGKVETRLLLYEVLGPYLWAEPWLKAEVTADATRNRWDSQCTSAISGGIGISAQIFSWLLVDFNTSDDFLKSSWPVCAKNGPLVTAQTLRVISGNNQQAPPGAVLQAFVVAVTDVANNGIANVPVGFAIKSGGGRLSTGQATTDVNGQAQTTLTLGSVPGVTTVEATVSGASGSPQLFTATAVEPVGLIAHYRLDGNGLDASGNGLHATVGGGTLTTDRLGATGMAYAFPGSGGILTLTDRSAIQPTAITVMTWVRMTGYPASTTGFSLVDRLDAFSPFGGYRITLRGTDRKFAGGIGTTSGFAEVLSPTPADLGRWSHLAVTYDGATIRLYQDGIQVAQQPHSGALRYSPAINLGIGGRTTGVPSVMNGALDEVRLFGSALGASAITAIYEAERPPTTPTTGLIGHYPLNGNANEATGLAPSGTVVGAAAAPDRRGTAGGALHFNGPGGSDSVRIPASVTNSMATGTIAIWVKLDDNNWQYNVFGKYAGSGNTSYLNLRSQFGGPTINSSSDMLLRAGGEPVLTATSVNPGTGWHHYVFTWSGSERRIYMDGIQRVVGGGGGPTANLGDLVLANQSFSRLERLKGSLDELRIYNRVLTTAEVQALYNSERP